MDDRFPMTDLNAALVVIGALVLGLGLVSGLIHGRLPLSIPLLALLAGFAIGPSGLHLLDAARWGPPQEVVLAEAARLTLAIGLMATALRLPRRYFLDEWRLQAVLIGVILPFMCVATALLVHVWLGVPLLLALIVGAVLAPTDPIVASAIVTSDLAHEHLPDRIRHGLSAESGANDGLATALVMLPVLMLGATPDAAWSEWVTRVIAGEIGGGFLLGGVLGYVAGRLLNLAETRRTIEQASFLAYTVALALLVAGAAGLLRANTPLSVFVAGLAFDSVVGGRERAEEANVQEMVNQFFTLPVFALIGLAAPVGAWLALGGHGLALAIAIVALRRLPAMLMLRRALGPLRQRNDALFAGWFGPIGVSAVLYAMEALHRTGHEMIWTIGSLVICVSIAAHGVTATPFTRRYGAATRR
jgi:sodium/hydrogen antiporter